MTVASEAIDTGGRAIEHEGQGAGFGTADDVKSILGDIAALITDVDRRHGEALTDMRARLAALGQEARGVRDRVPDQYRSAFERIEDSLAHLADRIAETEVERTHLRGSFAPAASAAIDAATDTQVHGDAAAEGAPQDGDAALVPAHFEPAPSAGGDDHGNATLAAAPAEAKASAIAPAGSTPAIDPFEIMDAGASDDDSPWNRDQAEALTRLYEAGEAGLEPMALKVVPGPSIAAHGGNAMGATAAEAAPLVASGALPHQEPLALVSTQPAPVTAHAVGTVPVEPASDVHREWLESKFAEIAERVELSLAEMRPDGAFANLETRFKQMETRFTAALVEVANNTDPEALRLVEAQIHELAQHVEVAQSQLQRLGSIEAQLTAVVDQLSDQRLAELLDQTSQMQQGDLQSLAMAAAEEVAARMAALQPAQQAAVAVDDEKASAAEAQRIAELRDMLHSFMLERRQGEENTASMLDTMQHAMIRLLDRVEAIEMNQSTAPQPAPIMSTLEAPAASLATVEPVSAPSAAVAAPGPEMSFAGPPAEEPTPARSEAPMPARNEATEPDNGGGPMSLEQLRAAARRAQAAAAAAAEADAAKKPAAKGSAKSSGKSVKPARADGGGSSTKRNLLVGALALIVLVPAALMLLPKPKGAVPAKLNSTIERPGDARPVGKGAALELPAEGMGSEAASAAPAAHADEAERSDAAELAEATAAGQAPAAEPVSSPASAPSPIETSSIDQPPRSLPGVSLQTPSRMPTVDDIARLRNQQQMAQISGQLGAAQARLQAEQMAQAAAAAPTAAPAGPQFQLPPGAKVVSVAQAVAASAPEAPAAQSAQEIGARASGLELPPAMVGPLSMRMAAAKGDPSAEFEVAARYAEGKGVQQDFRQAHAWYQRAASQGLAQAQYRLGTLFERGLGNKIDLAQARLWYQRAAEQGSVKAMHNLAVLSTGRDAGTPDYATAAQWFQQAAERGLADSQFNLAVLSENGLGVAKDLTQAYKWYALAAIAGDKESARRRDLLKSKLGPDDLVQADALVRTFKALPTDRMANDPRVAGEAWKTRQAAS